jgi:hypothetical protein
MSDDDQTPLSSENEAPQGGGGVPVRYGCTITVVALFASGVAGFVWTRMVPPVELVNTTPTTANRHIWLDGVFIPEDATAVCLYKDLTPDTVLLVRFSVPPKAIDDWCNRMLASRGFIEAQADSLGRMHPDWFDVHKVARPRCYRVPRSTPVLEELVVDPDRRLVFYCYIDP